MPVKKRKSNGSRCCVTDCSHYQLSSPGVLFHAFPPAGSERRKLWTDAVNGSGSTKPLSPTARILVCSDHFLPECYEKNLRVLADGGLSTKHSRLKLDAVPSVFRGKTSPKTADCSSVKRRRTQVRTFGCYRVFLSSPFTLKHYAHRHNSLHTGLTEAARPSLQICLHFSWVPTASPHTLALTWYCFIAPTEWRPKYRCSVWFAGRRYT